ncbi:MAG: hypothetical protein HZB47_05115 [Nitrosomonadales bacterium]|nr:hypothetical protein [Nitrosomonadales bacterium]
MSGNTDGDRSSDCEAKSGAGTHSPSSAGTFSLRRARYFSSTGVPLLNAEQRHELTNLVNEVDPDTKHHLIVQNLRMVLGIATRYTNRGLELVELIRIGNQGLIHALERYEPEGGICFSSFLTWCVSQRIELALMNQGNESNSQQSQLALSVSFDHAVNKHIEKCLEHPDGCSSELS